jgi:uncharacterized protein (TIGR02996 family)
MPTEEELLCAIDAAPDEDQPRLAHADWLEAHGDPERADYIRRSLSTERDTYYRWVAGLPCVHGMSWECRRGHPEVVRFRSLAAFKKGWPLTAGRHVRHVAFSGLRGAKLCDEPALAAITSLEMVGCEAAAVAAVLRSPHLGPLHHLEAGPFHPDDYSFLPTLAALPMLADLRSLRYACSSDALPAGPIAALVNSPHVGRLRSLRLSCWLSAQALRALWQSSLSALAVLEILCGNGWGPGTQPGRLDELGDGSATPNLERFQFTYHLGGSEAGLAVAGATRWNRLRQLDLATAHVGDAGAAALAGAPHLSNLESLTLRYTGISDAGAIALAGAPHLRSLSALDLSRNVIGRAGVAALGRSERLLRLRRLSLQCNPAPASLIEAVEARFRDGGPPMEEAAPAPVLPAIPAPSAPVTGHADEDGLVRSIWADPFDEVPRLIYADWLEEQGKPLHAAILRAAPAERSILVARLSKLVYEDAPCKVTLSLAEEGLLRVAIPVRSLRSKAFETHGPAWLRRHHIAEVCPSGTSSDWAGLFAAGWLAHTRGLSLYEGGHFDAYPALAASPHLAALASLAFPPNWRGSEQIPAFFRGAGLRGLCRFRRPQAYLAPEVVQAIGDAPFAPNLRHLAVGLLQDEPLSCLCQAPALAGLVTLKLGVCGDSGAKILADAAGLGALRNLDLSNDYFYFSDFGADALAGSPVLARLRRLRLTAERQSPAALERLARAAPAKMKLVLAGKLEDSLHDTLTAILGERLVVESSRQEAAR